MMAANGLYKDGHRADMSALYKDGVGMATSPPHPLSKDGIGRTTATPPKDGGSGARLILYEDGGQRMSEPLQKWCPNSCWVSPRWRRQTHHQPSSRGRQRSRTDPLPRWRGGRGNFTKMARRLHFPFKEMEANLYLFLTLQREIKIYSDGGRWREEWAGIEIIGVQELIR